VRVLRLKALGSGVGLKRRCLQSMKLTAHAVNLRCEAPVLFLSVHLCLPCLQVLVVVVELVAMEPLASLGLYLKHSRKPSVSRPCLTEGCGRWQRDQDTKDLHARKTQRTCMRGLACRGTKTQRTCMREKSRERGRESRQERAHARTVALFMFKS
jgi:hypothetical protein